MSRLDTDANLGLATTRPDGRPHLAPVWFVAVDGDLWVGTGADSVKVRNLTADARAPVALEDGDDPVVAEVTVELVARPFPPPVVGAFAAKYGWVENLIYILIALGLIIPVLVCWIRDMAAM